MRDLISNPSHRYLDTMQSLPDPYNFQTNYLEVLAHVKIGTL